MLAFGITAIAAIGLFLLWLFLAAPGKRRRETAKFARVHYAHRGLHDRDLGIPENSLAAFEKAAVRGYGIELDVQLSSDGIPIVFHDETLDRVCGRAVRVRDLTAAELTAIPLASSEQCIPTLAEALNLIGGRVPLLVEIKYYHAPCAVAQKAAALLDAYSGDYCIESFHPLAVRWFKRHRPSVVHGQLSMDYLKKKPDRKRRPYDLALHLFLTNFLARPDFIAYDLHDKNALVFRFTSKIFHPTLFGWTAKNEQDLKTDGFAAFIFESKGDPS